MRKNSNDKQKDKTKWIILLLLLITVGAVCVTVWALFFRSTSVVLAPDYAPEETEAYAQTIPNDSGEKKKSEDGGGSVSLTYSNQVSIDLSDESASLMFANPGRSNQDMIIQIVIQDQVIVQSGKLTAGNQVMTLDLLEDAAKKLSPGGYEGMFLILYYSQETGEKAIVNTEIPSHITVQE